MRMEKLNWTDHVKN